MKRLKRQMYVRVAGGLGLLWLAFFGIFTGWKVWVSRSEGLSEIHQLMDTLMQNVEYVYAEYWDAEPETNLKLQVEPRAEIQALVTEQLNLSKRYGGPEVACYDEDGTLLAQTGTYLVVNYENPPASAHRSFGVWKHGLLDLYGTLPQETADRIVEYLTRLGRDEPLQRSKEIEPGEIIEYGVCLSAIWTDGTRILPEKLYVYAVRYEDGDSLGYQIPQFDGNGEMTDPGTVEIVFSYENQPEAAELQHMIRIPNPQVCTSWQIVPPEDTPARAAVLDQERAYAAAHGGLIDQKGYVEQMSYGQMTASGLFSTEYYYCRESYLVDYLGAMGSRRGPWLIAAGTIHPLRDSLGTLGAVAAGSLGLFLLVGWILCWQLGRVHTAQAELEERRRWMTNAIAHDLKTPMAAVSGYAENLLEHTRPEKQEHYMQAICSQVDRMNGIVKQMLELGQLESPAWELKRTVFSLAELCREAAAAQPEGSWRIQGDAQIEADRVLLGRVLDNFFSNARQHAPAGEAVTVQIGPGRLEVCNPGAPIPEKQLGQLWEPYYQADEARSAWGSGLGLSIAREILQRHGFGWGAENRPGQVVFWFSWETL